MTFIPLSPKNLGTTPSNQQADYSNLLPITQTNKPFTELEVVLYFFRREDSPRADKWGAKRHTHLQPSPDQAKYHRRPRMLLLLDIIDDRKRFFFWISSFTKNASSSSSHDFFFWISSLSENTSSSSSGDVFFCFQH
jgi:hypothetical protein